MIHLIRDIEGRKIKIVYYDIDSKFLEQNKEFMKILDEQIISVCKEDKSAKNFPLLNFVIFGKNKLGLLRWIINNKVLHITEFDHIAFVKGDKEKQVKIGSEILKNDCTVYINSRLYSDLKLRNEFIEKTGPTSIDKQLAGVVAHELMHLRHFQLSRYSKAHDTGVRLSDKVDKINSDEIRAFLPIIRNKLFSMLEQSIREGIARFKQGQKTGYSGSIKIEYTKEYFVKEYEKSILDIKEILNPLDKIFIEYDLYLKENLGSLNVVRKNFKKIDNLITNDCAPYINYEIGFHMIFTIIYDNKDIDINMLVKMNYIEIIKLYEKSIIHQGYQPIISYTSRKGIFDYVGWLEKINDTYNAIEKYKNKRKK